MGAAGSAGSSASPHALAVMWAEMAKKEMKVDMKQKALVCGKKRKWRCRHAGSTPAAGAGAGAEPELPSWAT